MDATDVWSVSVNPLRIEPDHALFCHWGRMSPKRHHYATASFLGNHAPNTTPLASVVPPAISLFVSTFSIVRPMPS